MEILSAEEILRTIGCEFFSEWMIITQDMINLFSEVAGDRQYIHVNSEAAAATILEDTIVHGFLVLSLLPVLAAQSGLPRIKDRKIGLNYGCNRVRFLNPVESGKRIRGRFRLIDFFEKRPGQWQQTIDCVIDVENEVEPAMVAEWVTQAILDNRR